MTNWRAGFTWMAFLAAALLLGFTFAQDAKHNEDCIRYDPTKLRIVDEGKGGWLLTDGRSRMLMLDYEREAKQALALAKWYKF